MTELGEETKYAVCYPSVFQYEQWEDQAEQMGYKSVSRFMTEMVEAGYAQFDNSITYDERKSELRKQRNELKRELDASRARITRLEEQVYRGEYHTNIGIQALQQEDDLNSDEKNLKAVIYARTSSASQRFGYSIDEQVRQCWQRCQRLDWDVTHIFRDEAVSGKDNDRPMFQQLIKQVQREAIDIVVFWKLDRFSRSLIHAVQLEQEFREYGVALHSVTEQIDTTTPTGRFNFRNISSASEFERELITQRSQMGMKGLAMEHKWPNNKPPFGYNKKNNGKLVIDSDEADVVQSIFEKYIQLRSMRKVALSFSETTKKEAPNQQWTIQDISRLLRNELYIGEYKVAGVEEYVAEYQIVKQSTFDQVSSIRMRFQTKGSSRNRIPCSNKEKRVKKVVVQYSDYLKSSFETDLI